MNLSRDDHGDEEQIGIFLSQLSTLRCFVPLAMFSQKWFSAVEWSLSPAPQKMSRLSETSLSGQTPQFLMEFGLDSKI